MKTFCSFLVGCIPLLGSMAVQAQETAKKPLAIDDLYRFDAPRGLVLAPDGQWAVYVRQWIDPTTKKDRYSLWKVEGNANKAHAMEKSEPDVRSVAVSPDGQWLALLSTRSRPEKWKQIPATPAQSDAATDIWIMPAGGGNAIPLVGADKPYGRVFNDGFYGRVAFSPDGKQLVFVADDGADPRTKEEIDNDVLIVRPDQGEGYTGYGPAQIWVADLDASPGKVVAKNVRRLTKDDVWYGDPQWAPDGRTLVVHANKTKERESARFSINKNFDLWSINVASGQQRQLTFGPGPEVSPRFSPDGTKVACLSVPRMGSHRDVFNFAIVDLQSSKPVTKILFDHHGPKAEQPPHPRPSFPLPEDCWEKDTYLIYTSEPGVHSHMAQVEIATGKGLHLVQPAVNKAAEVNTSTVVLRGMRKRQLTPEGNLFLKERMLGEAKVITWKNDEGQEIEGVLTLPPKEVAKAPYKLIVYPHGGPHSRAALGFDFTVQIFAAHGYAVFQPNFRGSFGYGQKFIDADRDDLGGGDMRDILTGIDALAKKKLIDPERQFLYGVSYGGYMTCWLVGQTQQFKAAAAQNAVTDHNMMWGLSDIQSWTQWEFKGRPWEVPEKMRQRSPLTHVAKVKTPMLILHSRDDRRCPLPMGQAFHQALLALDVPTQMVIYPDEGHGIRQPRHREDVLRRVLAWFARHDK